MTEFDAGIPPGGLAPPPPPFKDRSTGLIAFGVMTILLGCLDGLFIALMLFGQAMSAKVSAEQPPFSAILPAIILYGALAVVLVWLGIGSIMARRWARALLLIFSWSWLCLGIYSLGFMAFLMPQILANQPASPGAPALPSAAIGVVMFFMFLVLGAAFIILPAVWILFYGSRHVRATCEARDPVTRWTDACPLPVLAICLWCLFSVPMMLVMPLMGHFVMPFFGIFLTGLPATFFCLGVAIVWSYAGWRLYRLDQRGWWVILIAMCIFMASGILTFARHDMMEVYRLMDYPEAQLKQVEQFGLFTGNRMAWVMSFSVLPFLGYILFVKKFFRHKQA